jgi:hypothetical protein
MILIFGMGVSAHVELRDFLLILSYPSGYTCRGCVQTAYDRGYKESMETSYIPGKKTGRLKPFVRDRIRGHMEDNFEMLRHQTKEFGRGRERGEDGVVFFNEGDKKAYFLPGKDEKTVRAWITWGIDLSSMLGWLIQGNALEKREFPTYEVMSRMRPNGWENHNYLVLFYYLQKFPGKNLLSITEESDSIRRSTFDSSKYPSRLKDIMAPVV